MITILRDVKLVSAFDPSSPEGALGSSGTAPTDHWVIKQFCSGWKGEWQVLRQIGGKKQYIRNSNQTISLRCGAP